MLQTAKIAAVTTGSSERLHDVRASSRLEMFQRASVAGSCLRRRRTRNDRNLVVSDMAIERGGQDATVTGDSRQHDLPNAQRTE
jgi:hypothetical protein